MIISVRYSEDVIYDIVRMLIFFTLNLILPYEKNKYEAVITTR